MTPATDILELARWAPSGDNTQPWRFRIDAPDHFTICARDTRDHCVYDLDGHASQISVGALLETIDLASSRFGCKTRVIRTDNDATDARPVFDVALVSAPSLVEHPLVRYITERSVQRRPMSIRPLSPDQQQALRMAVGARFELAFLDRAKVAVINFSNAKLRLTLPEAYEVHRSVIQWNARFSEDRVPDRALGASAPSLSAMRWALQSWRRVVTLNRYFAGTVLPRLEMDFVPGIACAAHCAIIAERPPESLDAYLEVGRAVQRFWLTATSVGLQFQPSYTPILFARFARERRKFTNGERQIQMAERTNRALCQLLGEEVAPRTVFMGRLGAGAPAQARSLRLPLDRLMV
jgi:hypothetical protein